MTNLGLKPPPAVIANNNSSYPTYPKNNNDKNILPVVLTVGDPLGIGPEITVKFLHWLSLNFQNQKEPNPFRPVIVVGCYQSLVSASQQLKLPLPRANHFIAYHPVSSQLQPGDISYQSLVLAVEAVAKDHGSFILTGPISKENLYRAGYAQGGHTEILETLSKQYYPNHFCKADMLFLYKNFRLLLLTRHVPLAKVSESLTDAGVTQSLLNLVRFFEVYTNIKKPQLKILGVNPHAGEICLLSTQSNLLAKSYCLGQSEIEPEESRALVPAIRRVNKLKRLSIPSPVAADAAFRGFNIETLQTDAFVAAYHDQGLVPFKLVAGMQAVNVTIGLPFLRTSVGHGTAPNIVGKGIATPESLIAAYQTGCQLIETKQLSYA
ncbi:MAG: 4-hydroxythreonine-4-phosphate dehydrogenase PdxA [Cyanobacteria bacterium P01_H01_bin.74]